VFTTCAQQATTVGGRDAQGLDTEVTFQWFNACRHGECMQVPVPHVCAQDRLLLAPLEFRGFYWCVARYGYMDKVDQVSIVGGGTKWVR
jgi:hypothetical protein